MKILHSAPFTEDLHTLAADLEAIVIDGLEATGERVEIVIGPADLVHFGTGCYAELVCRNRSGRTGERMKALAGALHARLARALEVAEPRIRIRVLLFDDDHAFGVN